MPVNNANAQHLYFRKAEFEDARLLWEWTNDPYTRSQFFNEAHVSWTTHLEWFSEKLDSSDCIIYIAENQKKVPIGQIRFEKNDQMRWSVSTSISESFRGMGLGSVLIKKGTCKFFSEVKSRSAFAIIKSSNRASIKSFLKAGYIFKELQQDINGIPCSLYEISRT